MIHLARKAKRLRIGWNRRALSEVDFQRLRKKLGVLLVEIDHDDMEWKGLYTHEFGPPTIIINARLRGLERLRVLFHELGHHIFHAPDTCFFSDDSVSKVEDEARAFSLVALIPKKMIGRMMTWSLFEDDLLPVELLKQRLKILELYGI
ncbi:MAG TPA: ImmA/IrrE family metallo-endopeptidase [Pyrinomonadaceae bacterium]|nr:ImmA/IrrE family metallo-endopeptidase [Pyrinomonadaceae bacterium]